MKKIIAAMLMLISSMAFAEPAHRCAAEAQKQAEKLLAFTYGPDERGSVGKEVKVLAPLRNPAKKSQLFDVLEVWGYVYKAQYRMHLIYAQMPGSCLLMGQEILEFSQL